MERGNRHRGQTISATVYSDTPALRVLNAGTLNTYPEGINKALQRVVEQIQNSDRPFTGVEAETLAHRFQDIEPGTPLESLDQALDELDQLYLNDAVHFHHPRYMAHLNCPVALPATVGELIQSALNTAVETWDQSAGATLIEQRLIDWTVERIGLGPQADGVFTSGGTQSNLMALIIARERFCQKHWHHDTRQFGLPREAHRLRIFCSEVGHFSIQKAAALMGLGYDAVVPVACDNYYRMDPTALEAAIDGACASGLCPMAVVATAGTTDFGSIDSLFRITELCRVRGLWCHVDAAYGCGLIISPRHRHTLEGIERADSVTVDYHKAFFQPVSCSACVVRNRDDLSVMTWHADYLNPLEQDEQGTPNLVDKSLQTTRRFDALKLWLTLRTLGADGIGEAFDQTLHLARQAYLLLLSDDGIEVLHQPQLGTLVFRYRPSRWLPEDMLDEANRFIRDELMRQGDALIATTKVAGRRYLKFTLLDPATQINDVRSVLRLIRQQGKAYLNQEQSREAHHA